MLPRKDQPLVNLCKPLLSVIFIHLFNLLILPRIFPSLFDSIKKMSCFLDHSQIQLAVPSIIPVFFFNYLHIFYRTVNTRTMHCVLY